MDIVGGEKGGKKDRLKNIFSMQRKTCENVRQIWSSYYYTDFQKNIKKTNPVFHYRMLCYTCYFNKRRQKTREHRELKKGRKSMVDGEEYTSIFWECQTARREGNDKTGGGKRR